MKRKTETEEIKRWFVEIAERTFLIRGKIEGVGGSRILSRKIVMLSD